MSKYNFLKFDQRNSRLENRITITKSNSIGFPTKFYRDNSLEKYKYAILFWDKERSAIGIRFSNDSSGKSGFTIIHSKTGYGGSIVVRSFFKYNNLDPLRYKGRYIWKKNRIPQIGDLFIIELNHEKSK